MVELVCKCIVTSFGVHGSSASNPRVSLCDMFVVAVFIGMTGVESMFGAIKLDLIPSPSLCIFDHSSLILGSIVTLILILSLGPGITRVCSCSGYGAIA